MLRMTCVKAALAGFLLALPLFVAAGSPGQVLTEDILSASYNMPVEVIYDVHRRARAILPRRNGEFLPSR